MPSSSSIALSRIAASTSSRPNPLAKPAPARMSATSRMLRPSGIVTRSSSARCARISSAKISSGVMSPRKLCSPAVTLLAEPRCSTNSLKYSASSAGTTPASTSCASTCGNDEPRGTSIDTTAEPPLPARDGYRTS